MFVSQEHAVVPKASQGGEGVAIRSWDWLRYNTKGREAWVDWLRCEEDVGWGYDPTTRAFKQRGHAWDPAYLITTFSPGVRTYNPR